MSHKLRKSANVKFIIISFQIEVIDANRMKHCRREMVGIVYWVHKYHILLLQLKNKMSFISGINHFKFEIIEIFNKYHEVLNVNHFENRYSVLKE